MTYFFTVLPLFAQDSSSYALFPRSTYTFGSIVGIILAYTLINFEYKKAANVLVIISAIVLLTIQFVKFNELTTNRYIINFADKYIAYEISDKINKYEKETGNKITNIALYNQSNAQRFYPDINDGLNISSRTERMSGYYLIRYYTQKPLNLVDSDQYIYNIYFKDKNWDYFNEEQVVLKDNTLHLYVY